MNPLGSSPAIMPEGACVTRTLFISIMIISGNLEELT